MNKEQTYYKKSLTFVLAACFICVTHAANAQSGTWSTAGTNAPRRDGHSMTEMGDKLYVFGGEDRNTRSLLLNSISDFSPEINSWTSGTSETNPPARRDHCAGAIDGKLYIFGGVGSNSQYRSDVWMYDPAFTNWFFQDTQGTKPTARKLSASASFNDKMYIFGGQDTNGYRGDLWEYNPSSTNWTLLKAEDPPFNSPPARSGAQAFVHEDKMYIFGGENEYGNPLQDMWKYSPASGTWMDTSPSGELPKPVKQYASAYTTTGTFWISGGQAEDTSVDPPAYKPTAATWQFVFSSNAWEQLTSAPQAHYGATAAWMTTNATRGTDLTTGDFLLLGGVVDNQTSDQFLRFSIQDTNQPPLLPTSISARIMDSNTVKVTWSASTSATGYEIWRALETNAAQQISSTTNLFYNDTVVSTTADYYYWVLAYNDYGTNIISGNGVKAASRESTISSLMLLLFEEK